MRRKVLGCCEIKDFLLSYAMLEEIAFVLASLFICSTVALTQNHFRENDDSSDGIRLLTRNLNFELNEGKREKDEKFHISFCALLGWL